MGRGTKDSNLLDGRNIVGGDVSTHDHILELRVLSVGLEVHRFNEPDNTRVLTSTTGLLLVREVEVGTLGDSLPERHAWSAGCARDIILALHTFDVDLEVQFTHTGDDSLQVDSGQTKTKSEDG